MTLDIGPTVPRALPGEEASLAARRQTGFGEYMGAMSGEGWWGTLAGQGRAQLLYAKGREDDPTPIGREDWEQSRWKRDNLDWFEGLTEGQARARAEIHDENAYRRWVIGQRDAGLSEGALGFGAMLAGSLPTPESLIAIGPAIHAARALKVGAAALQGARAGAIGGFASTAAVAPIVYPSMMTFGDDITFADVLLDLAVGTTLGAGLGAASGAFVRWRAGAPEQPTLTVQETQAALDAIAYAAQDVAEGRPVDLRGAPVVDVIERAQRLQRGLGVAEPGARFDDALGETWRVGDGGGESLAASLGEIRMDDGGIVALHASPHRFDRFSMDAIGTGEGAQTFGHGLYFAESPSVSGRGGKYDRQFERKFGRPSTIYQVKIAASQADLLDLDAPMTAQPESVRRALASIPDEEWRSIQDFFEGEYQHTLPDSPLDPSMTGHEFYRAVALSQGEPGALRFPGDEDVTSGPEFFSGWLRHHGVPGIRYLDGASRRAGDGTRNFVIFDDGLIEITHRDGVPVTPEERAEVISQMLDAQNAATDAPDTGSLEPWQLRNPADPDIEPPAPPQQQSDIGAEFGIDQIDQETADRFVAELDARGLIPDDIKAELEDAARLERLAARSRETHERAAWCAMGA